MTQALAPASPPARSVADLHARFLDAPAASRRDTTALVVAEPERPVTLFAPHVGPVETLLLYSAVVVGTCAIGWLCGYCLAGLFCLITTARDWCADTYTTLRARRGRTQ